MLYVRPQDLVAVAANRYRVGQRRVQVEPYVNEVRRRRRPLPSGPGQHEPRRPVDLPDAA